MAILLAVAVTLSMAQLDVLAPADLGVSAQDELEQVRRVVTEIDEGEAALRPRLVALAADTARTPAERRRAIEWLGYCSPAPEVFDLMFQNLLLHLPDAGRTIPHDEEFPYDFPAAAALRENGLATLLAYFEHLSRERSDPELGFAGLIMGGMVGQRTAEVEHAFITLADSWPGATPELRSNLGRIAEPGPSWECPLQSCYCHRGPRRGFREVGPDAVQAFADAEALQAQRLEAVDRLRRIAVDADHAAESRAEACHLLAKFPRVLGPYPDLALRFLAEHIDMAVDLPTADGSGPPQRVLPCRDALVRAGFSSLNVVIKSCPHSWGGVPLHLTPEIAEHYAFVIHAVLEPLGLPDESVRQFLRSLSGQWTGSRGLEMIAEAYP